MQVIICYDISDNKVRRKLVKYLEGIAVRIQYSVFVSDLSERAVQKLQAYADKLIKECDKAHFVIIKAKEHELFEKTLPPKLIYL